ncbi:uncharacterized protein I206_100107 [Kwoniella pini CBS 10737]|uniref:Peptidase A1 domain-containing protein n=1 Tax=Kwoniella pini CBS 10737 TaxID=1296096 RepID=A0A1B9IEE8_9TREE|nr:uncharacterized protein I206_01220 [Kwoniella pini CBS 10737]OCF53913.1 hypothetical protein I206_01220 [Kwoniella pini CBS 10737]
MFCDLPVILAVFSVVVRHVRGDDRTDTQRIGTEYTSMPLYRSGAGTNVMSANVGNPPTELKLTCSTNVDFFVVAATGCEECVENANLLDVSRSQSISVTNDDLAYVFSYPSGSSSTLSIAGRFANDIILDERGDEATPRPIVLAAAVQSNDPRANLDGVDAKLSDGSAGFWGMGVYQDRKANSMIPSMIIADNDGSPGQLTSYTVGFQINNFSTNTDDLAGTIHWGAVPSDAYQGNFNWLDVDLTMGGSWAFGVDRLRIEGEIIGLDNHFGTIDPGFDSIYLPTAIAERIFAKVTGAERDLVDTTRWNLPCDASIDLKIIISGTQYAIDPTALVRNRDAAGRTCWSSIVAWQNGSVPETNGEVRLGTPFMSGVYAALYYSDAAQYVGLAGKPNSVNAANLYSRDEGHANKKLAGILIGTLLGVLIFGFILCYARNRSSFQSIWYRALRRQQRAQMNAVVRGATMPPPMMPIVPIPMGGPMIPRGPPPMMAQMGMLPPQSMMGMGRMMPPPPPYQPPMAPQQYQQQQQQPLLGNQAHTSPQMTMPMTVQPDQTGFYSPRLQHTSPPKSNYLPLPWKGSKGRGSGKYAEPLSGGSRVHFGPSSARHTRSISGSGASVNEFGSYGRGPEGRHDRQNGFIREYQNLPPSHVHTPQYDHHQSQHHGGYQNEESLPPLAEVPEQEEYIPYPHQQQIQHQNEKKKYFSWKSNASSDGGGKGIYAPVGVNTSIQTGTNPNIDEQARRSWWNRDKNGGWKERESIGTPKIKRGLGWS